MPMSQPTPKHTACQLIAICTDGHKWLTINFQRRGKLPLYTLASVRFLSCLENHMDHNLRLWVITVDGQGIHDLPVTSRRPAIP